MTPTLFINSFRQFAQGVSLSYLLKTDFLQVSGQPVTLANSQVLDTSGEGVVTGSLVVKDVGASGIVQVRSNRISCGSLDGQLTDANVQSPDFSLIDGRILKFLLMSASSVAANSYSIAGLFNTNPVTNENTQRLAGFYQRPSGAMILGGQAGGGAVANIGTTHSINNNYTYALVIDKTGNRVFHFEKIAGIWQLLYIHVVTLPASGSFAIGSAMNNLNERAESGYVAISDTAYPNLVQTIAEDDFSEADGTLIHGKALDKGGSWTVIRSVRDPGVVSAVQVTSGYAHTLISSGTGVADDYVITDATGYSDVLMTFNVTMPPVANYTADFVFRDSGEALASADLVFMTIRAGSYACTIYEVTNGVWVLRGSTTLNHLANTTYPVQCRIVGNKVSMITPIGVVQATLASPETHTRHGFHPVDTHDANGWRLDDFKLYPATGYGEVLDAI